MALVVGGTLQEIEDKLLRIKAVIDSRKTTGWPLFQAGERWLYVTSPELGRVCPVCQSHSGEVLDGESVRVAFPYAEMIEKYVASPRTHMPDLSKFFDEPCHCKLILQNPAEVMEMRLHEEKLAVI